MTIAIESDTMAVIIGQIVRMAWPLWKAYEGEVPQPILDNLEQEGDWHWPHGCAAAAMRRISNDQHLRKRLETAASDRLSPVDQLLKDIYGRFPLNEGDEFCVETAKTHSDSGRQ